MNLRKLLIACVAILFSATSLFAQQNERGIDLYRAELYDAAKLFFLQQKNLSSESQAEAYYYLGQTYFELGKKDSAAYYYKKAETTDANYPFSYIGQGRLDIANKQPKEADAQFKKAGDLAKKDPSVYTSIAEIYIDNKMYKDAENALKKAEKVNKKYPGIYIVEGNKLRQEGDLGEAARKYENAIYFDKNAKEAYLWFARGYAEVNKELALGKLDELVNIDPNYIPAYALIGDINYKRGYYKSAIDAYEKFISIPGVPIRQQKNYAELLYFTDQYEKSLEQINNVLKQEPSDIIMLRLKGYNNAKLGRAEESLVAMNKFFEEGSMNPEFEFIALDYTTLGQVYADLGQGDESLAAYEKAMTMPNAKVADILKGLTSAYEKNKDYPKAIETFERYFALPEAEPVSTDYYHYGYDNYIMASKHINDEDDTVLRSYIETGSKAFDKVIERTPDSYLGYIYKARINSFIDSRQLVQSNNTKMDGVARPYYEEVIPYLIAKNENGSRDKDLLEAYNYFGSYYYVNRENALAGEYYKKMLEIDPEHEGAKSVLNDLKIKY
jgi:hypothetical protein